MTALWTPTSDRIDHSNIEAFRRAIASTDDSVTDTVELHRWSVEHPGAFWREVWDRCGVIGDRGDIDVTTNDDLRLTRFFPDASISFAENALAERSGRNDDAIVAVDENGARRTLSWAELRDEVASMAAALRALGVESGDRVAAFMPNVIETVVAFYAANAIGAVFTSTSSDFGTEGVVDRFEQTTPVVLIAADGYRYGGKSFDCRARIADITSRLGSVRATVVVGVLENQPDISAIPNARLWTDVVAEHRGARLTFERVGADHPIYILYSSGTTGKPKCITHRALGALLMHLKEQQLHCDVRAGDRVFYFTTCGWMMWNWLVSAPASGATIVLFDGNPFHPSPSVLFDLAEREHVTLFGVSAKYIDSVRKAGLSPRSSHDLSAVRTVCSTGSPLNDEGFAWVYSDLKSDVHLASISGGTDIVGCFVGGDPTRPVYAGEIQGPALGLNVAVFDADGREITNPDVKGDLVCTNAFPTVPVGFWGDSDGSKFSRAYFERFPGVWAHGDFASWTEHGGMVIHGRSDATLNAGGVRIGTAEIYAQVEKLPEVAESVAVGQDFDGDTRIVLFVRLADGCSLDDELQSRIKRVLRENASPRHVPARIVAVADIPRTRSNKISELAVTDVVNGRAVRNTEALANPDALDLFRDRPELST